MRSKSFIMLAIIIMVSTSTFAQKLISDMLDPMFTNNQLRENVRYSNIQGKSFVYEEWNDGYIINGKNQYENLSLQYDAYKDELLAKRNDKVIIVSKSIVDGFVIKDAKNESHTFKKLTEIPNQLIYAEVLYEGKLGLYYHHTKKIQKSGQNENTGYTSNDDKFISKDVMYIYHNNTFTEFSGKKKDLLSIFPSVEKELENFIKSNKLSLKKNEDLVSIIKFCESKL